MDIYYQHFAPEFTSALVALWNKEAPYDAMTMERFAKEVLADENFDEKLTLLAIDAKTENLVGFIIGVQRLFPYQERGTEPHRCFINMLAVDKEYQNQGIGKQMLKTFEEIVRSMDKTLITVGAYSPYYLFPGIDKRYQKALSLFSSCGYDLYGEAVAMSIDLSSYTYPKEISKKKASLEEKGFSFTPFTYEDTPSLLKFLSVEFGGGWKKNAMDAIIRGEAEKSIIVCKNENKEIIGSVQRSMDSHESRYGPFGVAENYRNLGLGTILFHEMMWKMHKEKIYFAYFLWSGGDAQRFYERQGMRVFRKFKLCKKEL